MYEINYDSGFFEYMKLLTPDIQIRINKKIEWLREKKQRRHLHYGMSFFVEEVGQYRLGYKVDENIKIITIYFVGKHKDYDTWRKNINN